MNPESNPARTESDLIPVRALNQATYCQRLYYLEYVESVMPINEFVEEGLFTHRRVDDPDLAHRSRKEGDITKTRGAALSSEYLGITAKLDLIEEEQGVVRPVETKRSAAPRDPAGEPTFWDNDAVQLCAQALLIEENLALPVSSGVIYYAGSRTRVDVPMTVALREQTLATIATVKELARRETPPEPLPPELRNRCFGCSLAPICLPEETLYLSTPKSVEQAPVTQDPTDSSISLLRVMAAKDERAVLYVQSPGARVGCRGAHLVVTIEGREVNRAPIATIRQIVVFGNAQVSTQALHALTQAEVPVVYLSGHGRFVASVMPAPPKNVGLRSAQYRVFSDRERSLGLARAVVAAKIANQRTLMMRSLRSQGVTRAVDEADPADRASIRASDEPAAREMSALAARVPGAPDPAVLLGLEGQAAALYFGNFSRMLKARSPGRSFDFTTRNRRPPRDPVNALLSFAYAMLAKDCFSAVCTVGFDPYQGFYHTGRHGRPSLALDLMEEFRPVIADSVVLSLINNGMLAEGDFLTWRDACQLTDDGRATFFRAYEGRKATEVAHPVFGYTMTYGRMLEIQARMLSGYVRGDLPAYTGFTVR